MKLIIEGEGLNVKAIKAEYTPLEWIIAGKAMRRFAKNKDVDIADRLIMKEMLSVVPIEFGEIEREEASDE